MLVREWIRWTLGLIQGAFSACARAPTALNLQSGRNDITGWITGF